MFLITCCLKRIKKFLRLIVNAISACTITFDIFSLAYTPPVIFRSSYGLYRPILFHQHRILTVD